MCVCALTYTKAICIYVCISAYVHTQVHMYVFVCKYTHTFLISHFFSSTPVSAAKRLYSADNKYPSRVDEEIGSVFENHAWTDTRVSCGDFYFIKFQKTLIWPLIEKPTLRGSNYPCLCSVGWLWGVPSAAASHSYYAIR